MNRRHAIILGAVLASTLGAVPLCRAAEPAPDQTATRGFSAETTRSAGASGAFLPSTQVAALDNVRAYAVGLGGYDAARSTSTLEAAAEVRVWGPIAVRGGAVYRNSDQTLRPSFGARFLALNEGRHGVDGAIGVFYRPEGLTEPEGEIESVVSLGRHLGSTYLLGNLLYGQDPEGRERDGEVRLAALRRTAEWMMLGLDGRLRFDLGSDAAKLAERREATFDALVGPLVGLFVANVAVTLQAGGSAVRIQGATSYGAFAMAGIATAL